MFATIEADVQDLVRRARARGSGASVHGVETLCAAFLLYAILLGTGEDVEYEFGQVETAMRTYIVSGHLPAPEWAVTRPTPPMDPLMPFHELIPFRTGSFFDIVKESRRLCEQSRALRNRVHDSRQEFRTILASCGLA